jgi:hypothetical protein
VESVTLIGLAGLLALALFAPAYGLVVGARDLWAERGRYWREREFKEPAEMVLVLGVIVGAIVWAVALVTGV